MSIPVWHASLAEQASGRPGVRLPGAPRRSLGQTRARDAAARLLDLPENLIGLSLIAVGTSLPELLVAVAAARRGRAAMLVGNVTGSNIANTLLILGLAATLHPLEVSELSVVYTIPIMLFFSLALLYLVRTDWRIGRGEGVFAVVAYAVFLIAAFVQGWE